MLPSSPIACAARPGDVESGLLFGSPALISSMVACTTPSPRALVEGVPVTPIQSSPITIETPRNIYTRSVSTSASQHSPPKRSGFLDNLKKRTRQRSINLPTSPDFDLSQDLGYPPIVEPPPEVFVPLARSAPDGGFFSSFRPRAKSEVSPSAVMQQTPSGRRQSGVLVFFPSPASRGSVSSELPDYSFRSPPDSLHSSSRGSVAARRERRDSGSTQKVAYQGGHPTGATTTQSKSFEGHLPGVNSFFSSSSNSSTSTTSESHAAMAAGCVSQTPHMTYTRASPRRPLYVDTQLANEQVSAEVSDVRRRTPLGHMVDIVGRRIRTTSLTSPSLPQPISARVSNSAEMAQSPRSPSVRASGAASRPPLYRYSRAVFSQQHSMDSGLDLSSPIAGMYGTALLIKEASFFSSSFESTVGEISTVVLDNQDAVYSLFMKAHKCYDLIPLSTKLVVFDTTLPVRKAFFALVYNGVRAAPLWDSTKQQFVGMLTITDFIKILYRHHAAGDNEEQFQALEEEQISAWRDKFAEDGNLHPLVYIDPNESLYRAVQMLCEAKVHRLPVLERGTGNISYILTHKRIMKFLSLYIHDLPKPGFMDETPKSLGIGSWGDVLCIHVDTPLIDALKIFLNNRVSALPLVDEHGKAVDVYAKFDVISLAADKAYNRLDITVHEALKHRQEWFEGVRTCKETDSLFAVMETIVRAEVHRLIVTDENDKVTGIISLSDILKFLVLDRCGEAGHGVSPATTSVSIENDVPVFDILEEEHHESEDDEEEREGEDMRRQQRTVTA